MNMKVICIDDKTLSGNPNRGLTFGKEYEVVKNHGKVFMIIDDNKLLIYMEKGPGSSAKSSPP